ncbi:MAG TPA: S24 family peptidase [Bryobacteraceae bacterium]|nr:S24 family peptidase [Bryobacteraceae bacterium]
MHAAELPFRSAAAARRATWSLLEMARAGREPEPLGILLVDEESGELTLRLRQINPESSVPELEEQESDFLAALGPDLEAKAREAGGQALLASLEDSLSGFLRIGERQAIAYTGEARFTAEKLFDEHVDRDVRPFVTHLPLYALRAAATKFGDEFDPEQVSEPLSWMRTPSGLRLQEGMFIAQVTGRSMEPLIPDASYCIFRAPVVGSRQGKRLLIEQTGGQGADPASRYTVKRYTSRKAETEDGSWEHTTIRLEPLNPEFEAFDLGPGDFRVIAEFVRVL